MKTVVGGHGHHTTQSNLWMQKGKYKIFQHRMGQILQFLSTNYGHNIDVNPNYLSYEHNTIH
jgi:hypothetical protein